MQADFMPVYSEHMRNLLKKGINHPEHYDKPLEGFHFLVDAGNGGGGFFANDVLAPLGADITGAANWEMGIVWNRMRQLQSENCGIPKLQTRYGLFDG